MEPINAIEFATRMITVAVEDGRLVCYLPNGERLAGEVFVRVHDEEGKPPTAIIKCFVRVAKEVKEKA